METKHTTKKAFLQKTGAKIGKFFKRAWAWISGKKKTVGTAEWLPDEMRKVRGKSVHYTSPTARKRRKRSKRIENKSRAINYNN